MSRRFWIYTVFVVAVLTVWLAAPPGSSSSSATVVQPAQHPPATAVRGAGTLPAHIERPPLEQASRDPFAMVQAAAPVVEQKKPVRVEPPPAPVPPPLNLRFTGRMTGPDGSDVIFVAVNDTPVSLAIGQTLPNGYKVTAIKELSIELSYVPMNFTTRFDLPAPPKYEIR